MSSTLSVYIGRQFLFWFIGVFLAAAAIIFLFDLIELMRRAASRPDATLPLLIKMALFKLPHMTQLMAPFAVLFGGMFAFWRLTRSNELVVARAAGVSVWQFLLPTLAGAILIGIIKVGLFTPLASAMLQQFEQIENKVLRGQTSALTISSNGLWLRQADEDGRSLIHAARVSSEAGDLIDVVVFRFEGDDRFTGRIDAASARLEEGYWLLQDAWLTAPQKRGEFKSEYRFETDMSWQEIEDSFASPETMSFWDLPRFIAVLEDAGFTAVKHRLYYHSLLAAPLLLCAMILIAATFSLRPGRRSATGFLVTGGITAGFLLYFLSDLVFALGLSGKIPVIMAAWTPAGVSTLLGISMLLHLEDG